MIENFSDLGLLPTDEEEEDIDKKVQEKLGVSLLVMKENLAKYLSLDDHVDEIVGNLINIAPYGDYSELMEDILPMSLFIKSDVAKVENWKLEGIHVIHQSLQFVFVSTAVDDGDSFKGFVLVSFSGKIQHAFCQGECA